jgi:hypothetical protein
MKPPYTSRQGQFLAFIHHSTTLHGRPPAEAEMARFFQSYPSDSQLFHFPDSRQTRVFINVRPFSTITLVEPLRSQHRRDAGGLIIKVLETIKGGKSIYKLAPQ